MDTLFGIPGGTISPVFDGAQDHAIRVVTSLHEGMAGYQALGYAHARGVTGAVAVTSGPGLLNLTTAAAAATEDEVPLLILAGEVATDHQGMGVLQDGREEGLNVLGVFGSLCKHVARAETADDVPQMLEEALNAAESHPRGAVLLALPVDLLERPAATPAPASIATPTTVPLQLNEVADALSRSQRPVLWLGVGARAAACSMPVLAFAELHRATVITDVEAKGLFPERHPLSAGLVGPGSDGRANAALDQADLILTVGARLDPTTAGSVKQLRGARAYTAHIDHSLARLSRHPGVQLLSSDLGAVLDELSRAAGSPAAHLLIQRDLANRSLPARGLPQPLDLAPHEPGAVVQALQRHCRDAAFTSDIGNHLLAAAQHLVVDGPDQFFVSHGLAGMTSGIGSAMGIAMSQPGRRVVSICGDGGMMMCGTELATCAREGLAVTFAVFEDGHLGMVDDGMNALFGRCEVAELPKVDLVAMARALGVRAHRVSDARHLARVLRDGQDGPLLLAFPVSRETVASPRIQQIQSMRAS
ncbi:MAG: thiamine pyrophosphate-binding protein [Proteobacteria bacterium]|nr:thiamine pyrophosphate-binding protein [Pseudomonadota bacterium]